MQVYLTTTKYYINNVPGKKKRKKIFKHKFNVQFSDMKICTFSLINKYIQQLGINIITSGRRNIRRD